VNRIVHIAKPQIDKPIIAEFAILKVGQHVLTDSDATFCGTGAHWIHYDQVDRNETGCSDRKTSFPATIIAIGDDSHHSDSRVIPLVEIQADDNSWSGWSASTGIVPLLPKNTAITITPFDGQVTQATMTRTLGGSEQVVDKGTYGIVVRQGSDKHETSVLIHFTSGKFTGSEGWVDNDEIHLRGSLIVLDHMEARSEGTSYYNTSSNSNYPKPLVATPAPNPAYVLSTNADFWETDTEMCNGMDQAAEALAAGQQIDTSSMDGHHDITAGTRVTVTGHKTGYCPGTTTKVSYTMIEVQDGNSSLNNTDGYIVEGILTKE